MANSNIEVAAKEWWKWHWSVITRDDPVLHSDVFDEMLVLLNNCVTGCFTPRLDLVVVGPDWFLASSLTSKPSPYFDCADELVLSSQPLTPNRKLLRVMTFIQLSAPTDEEGPTSRGFGSRGMKGHWGGLANRLVELRVRCMYILVYILIYDILCIY